MITASLHAGSRSADHHRNYRSDKGTSRPIKKITCVYCKGIHTTNSCNIVVNTEKRLEHIKREGLCFNCLGKHRVSQCTSHARCKKCNNKHHISICNAVSTKPQQSMEDSSSKSTEAKSNQTPKETIPVASTIALSDSQTSVLCNPDNSVCLLKTAVTSVISDVGSATANILFDEGAQRSFISKGLADTLQLTPL